MLKSPRRIALGERDEITVRKAEKSLMNSELGVGGRYTVATVIGDGPFSLMTSDFSFSFISFKIPSVSGVSEKKFSGLLSNSELMRLFGG